MPDKLQNKCGQWDNCVSKSATHKKTFVALLRAGVGGEQVGNGGSLTQVDVTANEAASATDPNACVDPAADDAESWDCECLDDMVSGCGGSDSDSLEECLRDQMCTLHAVCGHWKQDNCPKAMIQNKSTDAPAKLLQRQKGQEDMDLSGSLDGSLEGKCTSETQ